MSEDEVDPAYRRAYLRGRIEGLETALLALEHGLWWHLRSKLATGLRLLALWIDPGE